MPIPEKRAFTVRARTIAKSAIQAARSPIAGSMCFQCLTNERMAKSSIQRHHCASLVWLRLTGIARKTQQTVHRITHGLLNDYLCQQLKNPSVRMRFAPVLIKKHEPGGIYNLMC